MSLEKEGVNKEFSLLSNEVEMHDALLMLDAVTDSISFLSVVNIAEYGGVLTTEPDTYVKITFALDNKVKHIMRKRYNFWQALGDIGGLYDGLRLIVYLFMAPLSSAYFFNDTL